MSEWWSYRPHDLLMFSPETYDRLFVLYNRDWWPLHVVAVVAGCALVASTYLTDRPKIPRIAALALAVAWGWVGWAFLLERYATIHTAGRAFAIAFFVQGTLLGWAGFRGRLKLTEAGKAKRTIGIIVAIAGLALYPFVAPLSGREWAGVELFGMAPDPTAIVTIGLLLVTARGWRLALLLVIPALWVVISAMTLAVM